MESIPLDMDDIFGEDGEDDFNPSRLPDLEDELAPMRILRDENEEDNDADQDSAQNTDNVELLAKLKSMKGASKNMTKRYFPKFDAARLTGERGIPILPKVFKNVTLKGKNHECEDLKIIMRHLEHWGHRLFPRMPFGEVLERVERLGKQKSVSTCVKRIRLDLPVLPDDNIDEDDVQRLGDNASNENVDETNRSVHSPFPEIDEDELEDLIRDQEEAIHSSATPSENSQPSNGPPTSTEMQSSSMISEDVKERIERNKQLALERRAAKLAQKDPQSPSTNQTCAVADDTTSGTSTITGTTLTTTESTSEMETSASQLTDNNDISMTGYLPDVTDTQEKDNPTHNINQIENTCDSMEVDTPHGSQKNDAVGLDKITNMTNVLAVPATEFSSIPQDTIAGL